ncbi:MAG: hypothetical protein P8Y18_10900 [Candidatus Bathyarchaeota archaeon]
MVVVEEKVISMNENIEEPHAILKNLIRAEETLLEEKRQLESTKSKLILEAKKKIDDKMKKIQNLRDEITDLKCSCDELTNLLKNK